jgi:hypothetical protein
MDYKREIESLAAETLALQNVMAHVLHRVSKIDPSLAAAIKLGFDDAANGVESVAIRFGKSASADHAVKAIRIVEQLRAATLGDPDKPKHAV